MILIAESGSTKTDWRILNTNNEILKAECLGLNPHYLSEEAIENEIRSQVMPHITEKIQKLFFYGTGITDVLKMNQLKNALTSVFGAIEHLEICSDVDAAAKSLFGNTKGLACILGTGSNSCVWDGNKITFQIPPLGFWLGDEGSGAHLGKGLVLAYLHHEMPENVRVFFEIKFGKFDRIQVFENMKTLPNRYFAGFSIFAYENLHLPFIQNLVKDSLAQFFEKYLLKYPDLNQMKVGFVGSVAFYYQNLLHEVASNNGIEIFKIVQKPIDELVKYHQNIMD